MPTHPSHHDPDEGPIGTTRTRLPEGGSAATRRPARSSRTLVTVVGVVVLLIAALAFATRGTGNSSAGSTASGGSGTNGSGPGPQAAPTPPTGTRPVTGHTDGIPTGYPRTAQGAQSAAANYAVALGGNGMFTPTTRHAIVSETHDPGVVAGLQGELDKAYSGTTFSNLGLNPDGTAPSGFVFVSRTVPVGTKATAYSSDSATIEVWSTSLAGLAGKGSTKPVTETWLTITEQLKWVDNDWKIDSSSQTQGPAPIGGDQQAATAQEIAGAVNGYGGFTYAR